MSGSLDALVRQRSLIVCVGPGGVGKTTVSAAVGLAGARAGRRTLVLTIDPARRLADALGLPGLDDEIRSVSTAGLPGGGVAGSLDAAMVDTAASYESLIRRIAPDTATFERIMGNRVFQAVSRSMARSHAYVAMERLYDAAVNHEYDLVVLDTPPARNALDILDAPTQLARFLDAKIVGWFLPGDGPRGIRDRLIQRGGEVAKKLLGLVTGPKLLDEILGFLEAFVDLREGFAQRAAAVEGMLRAPSTGFVLVSSASPASADDAAWLRHDLERRQVPIDAVVFNQSYVAVHPSSPGVIVNALARPEGADAGTSAVEAAWSRLAPHLRGRTALKDVLVELRSLRADAAEENARYQRVVDGICAELPPGCMQIRAPRFDDEIRDLAGLLRLVEFVAG